MQRAGPGPAEHLVLQERVANEAPGADPDLGRGYRGALVDRREDAKPPHDEEREEGEGPPEDREDERIRRDVLEHLEHQGASPWSCGPASVSSA